MGCLPSVPLPVLLLGAWAASALIEVTSAQAAISPQSSGLAPSPNPQEVPAPAPGIAPAPSAMQRPNGTFCSNLTAASSAEARASLLQSCREARTPSFQCSVACIDGCCHVIPTTFAPGTNQIVQFESCAVPDPQVPLSACPEGVGIQSVTSLETCTPCPNFPLKPGDQPQCAAHVGGPENGCAISVYTWNIGRSSSTTVAPVWGICASNTCTRNMSYAPPLPSPKNTARSFGALKYAAGLLSLLASLNAL